MFQFLLLLSFRWRFNDSLPMLFPRPFAVTIEIRFIKSLDKFKVLLPRNMHYHSCLLFLLPISPFWVFFLGPAKWLSEVTFASPFHFCLLSKRINRINLIISDIVFIRGFFHFPFLKKFIHVYIAKRFGLMLIMIQNEWWLM